MGETRSLAAELEGAPAGEPPAAVTCVVLGETGLTVIAESNGRGAEAGSGLDLAGLATALERAAAALRGGGATVHSVPAEPAFMPRRAAAAPEPVRVGQLEIHPESRLIVRDGQPVPLSRIEFDLFLALVRRAGAPATRLDLVREVWGFGAAVTSRSVDTQIYNLRHKLEENPATPRHLLTVSGVGYRVAS